jgi:hypothetical protein
MYKNELTYKDILLYRDNKMNLFTTLEISNVAAACGKNPYENRQKIQLLVLCRKYKDIYKDIFKNLGIIEYISQDIKTFDVEIKEMYLEHKKTVDNPKDFKTIEKNITDKMKLKKEITKKDLDFAKIFLEASLKKDCGTNSEKTVIKKQKYTKGNNCMFSYTNPEFNWTIRGFHDATDNDVVIEIKTRMKLQNVRRNEYDLYQLFGYLLVMNKTRGKIVQYFNEIVYDSDIPTFNEFGIVDITTEPCKSKFETFIGELGIFFKELNDYSDTSLINIRDVIKETEWPIALYDKDDTLHNVNPAYEKIIQAIM